MCSHVGFSHAVFTVLNVARMAHGGKGRASRARALRRVEREKRASAAAGDWGVGWGAMPRGKSAGCRCPVLALAGAAELSALCCMPAAWAGPTERMRRNIAATLPCMLLFLGSFA